jgi:serine/threonine protein phosphatase 1
MVETQNAIFVHAGIDPMVPLKQQADDDLVFIRSRFFESPVPPPKLVVHGHTPVRDPDVGPLRLNIDTGAFQTGRLTAARLWNGRVHILST